LIQHTLQKHLARAAPGAVGQDDDCAAAGVAVMVNSMTASAATTAVIRPDRRVTTMLKGQILSVNAFSSHLNG
jgi:hypothetical protein